MKLFISWSGDLSKEIAEIFRQWIPGVIQAAKPYYSPDDITKGTRWSSEIAKELDLSKIGIICLTKENLKSPWIMFEAGALSKNLEKSKVCPLLFGIEPTEIKGPLVQFQAAKFSKKEMKKVIKMMNDELETTSLSSEVLDSVFEMWWPKLEEQIEKLLEKSKKENNKDLRSERDLIEEVLSLTRRLSIDKRRRSDSQRISPRAIRDLIDTMEALIHLNLFEETPDQLIELFDKFHRPIKHIIEELRDEMGTSLTDDLEEQLAKVKFMVNDYSNEVTERIKPRIKKKPRN